MANIKTVFLGTESSGTENKELVCYANLQNEIYIKIEDVNCSHDFKTQSICLDVPTAIKLAKTLRTHINLIKSS